MKGTRILLCALFSAASCSINSYHDPRTIDRSDAQIGVSWTAFPINEDRVNPDDPLGDTTVVTRLLGFPTVWLRYGLAHGTEAGMGIALFRYTPSGSDQTVSSITATPYIKREIVALGPALLTGFAEAGGGTGRFFIAQSDSSWDTASQAYFGSAGAVPGLCAGNWEFSLPVKYTFTYIPTLLSVGFFSAGPDVCYRFAGHRVYAEAMVHYAGGDLMSFTAGGGFDF